MMTSDLKNRVVAETTRLDYVTAIKHFAASVKSQLSFLSAGRSGHFEFTSGTSSHCSMFAASSPCDARQACACELGRGGHPREPRTLGLRKKRERAVGSSNSPKCTNGACGSTGKKTYNCCPYCDKGDAVKCHSCFTAAMTKEQPGEHIDFGRGSKSGKEVHVSAMCCSICQTSFDSQLHLADCEACNGLQYLGGDVVKFVAAYCDNILTLPEKDTRDPAVLAAAIAGVKEELAECEENFQENVAEVGQLEAERYASAIALARKLGVTELIVHETLMLRVTASLACREGPLVGGDAPGWKPIDKEKDFKIRAGSFAHHLGLAEAHVARVYLQKRGKHEAMRRVEESTSCGYAMIIRDYWMKLKVYSKIQTQGIEPPPGKRGGGRGRGGGGGVGWCSRWREKNERKK